MRRFATLVCALVVVAGMVLPATATPREVHVTGRELTAAAPFGYAAGMDFDNQGNLWVGSILSRTIIKRDPDSGRILARFGPAEDVEGPDDLAVGPDGAVYYTAIFTGEVGRLNRDGTHDTIANLGLGVNPITFSDDGRLFVGKSALGPRGLWELDPDGVEPPRLISATSGVNGFDWWDGHLYAPDPETGEIFRIDVDTGTFTVVVDGLEEPGAVDIDAEGHMYVVEPRRVLEFDPVTGATEFVAAVPSRDNMAIDADGRIFVSGGLDGAVYRVLPNGKVVTVSPSGLTGPQGLAVLADDAGHDVVHGSDVFVVNAFDGRTGKHRGSFDGLPLAAAIDPYGQDVAFASWFTNTVGVRDMALGTVTALQSAAAPLDVVAFGDDLVVSELGTASVVAIDPLTGSRTVLAAPPHTVVPSGLAATGDALWVADWATGMVLQLVDDGMPLDPPVVVASGLDQPEGMAVTSDGDLVVVEAGAKRLSLVRPAESPVTPQPLVDGLGVGVPAPPGLPPTWNFDDVAVGPSGAVYVSGAGIQRYELR